MSEARKQQQVDYLKHQIDTGAAEAKSYLDKLKKGIYEYDQKHPSAQKATDALCSGLDAAEASVEELAHVGAKMTAQAKEKSDQSMELARETLQKVKEALHALQDKAREYDAKFADSTGAKVVGDVSDTVESIVNSMRQRTTDAIDKATEEMSHMKDSAQNAAGTMGYGVQVAAGEVLRVGDMVDAKLGVTEKASGAAGAIAETVKSIDQRMHVTETAAAIDSKVTGGLGARVVTRGVEIVQESIEYVTETLQQAKIAASKSGTAQSAEQQASSAIDSASATADAAKVQATAAKDQAINTANNALDRTMEVAGAAQVKAYDTTNQAIGAAYNARDKTMEMAGQATNTALGAAGLMTDEVKQGASNAKATVSDTAEAAKQGAHNMTANAQQKGSEMRASANKGAVNAKQAAHETARSAKDTAQDATDATEQKGREWTGAGSRSSGAWGHESSGPGVVDSAKQTAQSAKDTVVDAATRAKDATIGSGSNSSSGTSHHTHRVDDYDLHVGAKNPRTNKVVIEVNAPGVSK